MAKKTRSKKKAKKVTKRKVKKTARRRPVRRAKKGARRPARKAKNVKKVVKKSRAKMTKKKSIVAKKKLVKTIAEHVIGKVTHYYDRIGVAVVAVSEPIHLGDIVLLKHGDRVFEQKVASLQVNHTPINSAAKGQEVGMKVDEKAEEGTVLLPA